MEWKDAQARLRTPVFAPLRPVLDRFSPSRWPGHAELTEAAHGVTTSRGQALRFVPPRGSAGGERRYYELHIADSGEVETRPENWHDFFNALAWITFPEAKKTINAQHVALLEARGEEEAKRRSPERDALTLFDEGGVIVATSSAELRQLIVDFAWKELFWHRRAELEVKMRFIAFGHNLYEKALEPHLGMVAKTVFIPYAEGADADALVAAHFSQRANFPRPKVMAPMPVLGIPGWHPDTGIETFYDDPGHFRGPRPK